MIDIKKDHADNRAYKLLCVNLGIPECEIKNDLTATIMDDERLLGVITFSMFNPKNCFLSFYTIDKSWASRKVIRWIIDYALYGFKARKITCNVDRKNKQMRNVLERIGFLLEGCVKYGRNDCGDACFYRFDHKSKRLSKFFKTAEGE